MQAAANDASFGHPPAPRGCAWLDRTFEAFGLVRVACFVPTLWAMLAAGVAAQHSLLTWAGWLGANTTTAAWLFVHGGRRIGPAVCTSLVAAAMCLTACGLIVGARWL